MSLSSKPKVLLGLNHATIYLLYAFLILCSSLHTVCTQMCIECRQLWNCRSVGCILAETVARKPLFQGNNPKDQIVLLVQAFGMPSDADMRWIKNAGNPGQHQSGACWGEKFG